MFTLDINSVMACSRHVRPLFEYFSFSNKRKTASLFPSPLTFLHSWFVHFHTNFCSEWVLGLYVISYILISYTTLELLSFCETVLVKEMTYFAQFVYLNSSFTRKSSILIFLVPREINSRFCNKTQWQIFLPVSGLHCAHDVSLQVSQI